MLITLLLNAFLLLPRAIFGLLGLLPFVSVALGTFVPKFIGWGCYMCGIPVISALFISIFGWCTVFTVAGVFKFIKNYVPLA